ncbi:MAG: aldehyde dehydrogenase family protein, partial [Bacteroidia bacterium]|nr:aldehyde dehydrogenase family protein [Bacteroidia bacterium]
MKKTKSNKATKLNFSSDWKYAPAPEGKEHIQLKERYDLFINGKFVAPDSGKYFPTINPATEQKIAEVAEANDKDVDTAVQSARTAYEKTWKKLPAKERGKYIYRIARIMQERARELAIIETIDGGKPIRESRDIDIPLAANHFFYYAGWADKIDYAIPGSPLPRRGVRGE